MSFLIQPSFTGGELAPSLGGRVDLAKYAVGAATMKNMFCHASGGFSNRAGTYLVGEIKNSAKKARNIPFIFSTTQAYALEFGDLTMRVVMDGGYVMDGGSPYEVGTPYSEADLPNLQWAQSAAVLYIVHPDHYPRAILRSAHDAWGVTTFQGADGPYATRTGTDSAKTVTPAARSGNNVALTASSALFNAGMVGAPFRLGYVNPDDPDDIIWGYGVIDQYTDSTNARIDIVDPFGFEYISNNDFTLDENYWEDQSTGTATFDVTGNQAILTVGAPGNFAQPRQELSVVAGVVYKLTIDTASISAGTGDLHVHVGKTSGSNEFLGVVIAAAGVTTYEFSPTQSTIFLNLRGNGSAGGEVITLDEVSLVRNDLATTEWRQPAWTDARGYPSAVTFFEQRLCFGGANISEPDTIYESRTGGYTDFGFSSPLRDDDSLTFTLASAQINVIRWMIALGQLLIGTSGAEWRVSSGSQSDSMTPSSIDAKPQSNNGSAALAPLVIGNSVLFVQRGATVVRDLLYSLERDGYTGSDLSIMANHLFKDHTIVAWAYARLPDSIIWCVRDDGKLLGLTYLKEHEVWGWHLHETDGLFEDVCVIPGDISDDVYFIVKRTIQSVTKRFIEQLQPRITDETIYAYYFVDSGLTYDGYMYVGDDPVYHAGERVYITATTIGGLSHLEAEEVIVLADGEVIEGHTVDGSGEIELDDAAKLVHVGLSYVSDFETLDLEAADDKGTSLGRTQSIPSVSVLFEDTRGASIGPDSDHLDEITFEGDPPPLFTGKKHVTIPSTFDDTNRIFIRQTDPLPITALAIVPDTEVSDG